MDQAVLTVLVVAQARVLVVNVEICFTLLPPISITFPNFLLKFLFGYYADSDSDSSGHGSDTGN